MIRLVVARDLGAPVPRFTIKCQNVSQTVGNVEEFTRAFATVLFPAPGGPERMMIRPFSEGWPERRVAFIAHESLLGGFV